VGFRVTLPPPEQPPTLLDEARDALYAALQRVWVALGWPEERAERLPPATVRAPAAWVDVPVMHQAPTEGGQTFAATFPVVFVVDGAEQSQVEMQDKLLAYGWQQLDRVKLGDPGRQRAVLVQTFGPEDVDTGGVMARALVARVQIPLQTRTLCRQTLVQDDGEGTP
jgi:hypothetical protein